MTDEPAFPKAGMPPNGLTKREAYAMAIAPTLLTGVAGKAWADYNRLGSTEAFLHALSSDMGIPISDLVQSIRGGQASLQGTWVHPQVAINLAQWLSP